MEINLEPFKALNLPDPPTKPIGFLDIIDQTQKETTICKAYRHFLDPKRSKQISASLLKGLINLVKAKQGNWQPISRCLQGDYQVELEVSAKNEEQAGRIDIVLQSLDYKHAIIFEVKINHELNNNLQLYWKRYKYPENKKLGIILALYDTSHLIDHDSFISITHKEWLEESSRLLAQTRIDIELRQRIYFEDLVENMQYLTKTNQMNDYLRQYFQKMKPIEEALIEARKAQELRKSAMAFVIQELTIAAKHFKLELGREIGDESYYAWDPNRQNAYLRFYPEKILSPDSVLRIELELFHPAFKYQGDLDDLWKNFDLTISNVGTDYARTLAYKEYELNDHSIYEKFSDFVIKRIKENFETPLKKVLDQLEKH